jgi:hypothetical protein
MPSRTSYNVRLARPDEGPVVQRLVAQGGGPTWDWLDWSRVHPYWLLGEVNGTPKATLMVNPGVPIGRMEFLCLSPHVSQQEKAILCRDLSYAGLESCRQMGAQVVMSNIDTGDGAWRQIAEKRGWVVTGEGSYMMKRCV